MFLSFDGVDGAGKSTQMNLLCQWLGEQGCDLLTCRDPGSTALGERLRKIVLDKSDLNICLRSEMLIYMAARAQLVDEVVRPALTANKIVVSDRFLLANVVYQGRAGGLDVDDIWNVGQVAIAGVEPDLTLLLDMSAEAAGKRIDRDLDRMEARGLEYLENVRQGFLKEASCRPERIVVIDAAQEVDLVQKDIRAAVEPLLRERK